MSRWIRGPELERTRERDAFDPVVEGARHRLSRELALAIWEKVCIDATDRGGRCDLARAKRAFHKIAARIAARGGRLGAEVGRSTQVETSSDSGRAGARGNELASRAPGRQTRVDAEALRWAASTGEPASADRPANAINGAAAVPPPPARGQRVALDATARDRLSRLFAFDLSRVEVVPDSPAATGSIRALSQDGAVHFRDGAYRPGTPDGDWLIAHELAHLVQQHGGADRARTGMRKELEREADRAATLATLGRTAPIVLRAQPGAAYAFDDSEAHDKDDQPFDVKAELDAARAPVPGEGGGEGAPPGGGGAPPRPDKQVGSVAGARPEAGLAQLPGVRPDRLAPLLGQVHTANATDTAKTLAEQRANPPKQMSSGVAVTPVARKKPAAPTGDPKASGALPDHPVKGEVPGGAAAKQAKQGEAAQQQKDAGQAITAAAHSIASFFSTWSGTGAADTSSGNAGGDTVTEAQTQEMAGSVGQLSTNVDTSTNPGPPPQLEMKDEARGTSDHDRSDLETKTAGLETQGHTDSREPMGEDHIQTTVPTEELKATLAGGAVPAATLPTLAGAASTEEIGLIAQEQSGTEIDAALTTAGSQVTADRGKHAAEEVRARADADTQMRDLKSGTDADQAAARTAAQAEVTEARGQWQGEIDKKGAEARKQADKKVAEGLEQVDAEQTKANTESRQHIDDGQRKADDEKQKGEKEAADAKDKGKQKSSGFFGWLADKAKQCFDGIKKAVTAAIDACRRAIKAVIDAAKKLAMAAIELARKAIVAAIKAIGEALIAISDVLLAAFPELKAKFQTFIHQAVDKAVDAVNKLADDLKKGVQKALDMLGAVLDKALQLLEKGIQMIIDAANALVQSAIEAARTVVEALGTWAKLIKDVASGPGAWIKNLGAAVIDGIKNHLWAAFKTAVVEWFKSKIFEILGVGGMILEILIAGGVSKDDIIHMALDALIVAIPMALVAILIEKVVSMIVPAAGALMAIIEGLQAAWGTISRIIAAFAAFMAFLLAVKSGGAGPQFAVALAAGAVVVLDFVSNWLLRKLASAARKVGDRLKAMSAKIAAKLKGKGKGKGKPDAHAPGHKPDADGPDARAPNQRHDHDDDVGPDGKPRHHDDDDVGPDGKPRHRDDDIGPDGKPRHRDDDDGPNGKHPDKDKDHKNDKDKDHKNADVRAAARRAADQGWHAAMRRCDDRVVRESELEAALRSAEGVRSGIRIKLDIVEAGTSWKVKAHASKGSAHATDDEGHGWIARGEHGERWYAARDLSSFNETLIKEALGELKRPDPKDERHGELRSLRDSYQDKVEAGRRVEHTQQGRLDGKVHGLKLSVEMEPFSGAEKDKKVQTTVTVAPNVSRGTGKVDLEETRFPDLYEIGPPQSPTKVARVGSPNTNLRPIQAPPMKSPGDRWPGYVINMAAIPDEVKSDMATRYIRGAWQNSDEEHLGVKRTAVVVGVNTRERLDSTADDGDKQKVAAKVPSVVHSADGEDITMAAFGFAWEPGWINKQTHARVSMTEVRARYKQIEDSAEKTEAANLDKVNAKTLPYGIFREEVLGSDYTQTATRLVSAIADPVHVLSQDADGKVNVAGGKGVLAEYDEVLRAMDRQPMLVIGGYNFDHFEWDEHDPSRKQQLTRLANELDRAIRAALAKIYPDMLYPSEPNTLMKAHDERDGGGIFQDPQHRSDLEAARVGADGDRMGAFYGLGQNEGRNAMLRMRQVAGDDFSMAYTPSAGTSTSPLPNNDARGLVRHSGMVHDAADGRLQQGDDVITDPRRRDPFTGMSTQSQSYVDPRTQAREFDKVTPVTQNMPPMTAAEEERFREGHRQALREVFMPAEDAARSMVRNPDLGPDSPEMQQHRARVDEAVQNRNQRRGPASEEAARRAIAHAGEICKQLITAMSADEFRSIWQRLQDVLLEIMSERPHGGAQGGR